MKVGMLMGGSKYIIGCPCAKVALKSQTSEPVFLVRSLSPTFREGFS